MSKVTAGTTRGREFSRILWAVSIGIVVLGIGAWIFWPTSSSKVSAACPGQSKNTEARAKDIACQDKVYDSTYAAANKEYKRLYFKDGSWIAGDDSSKPWSDGKAEVKSSAIASGAVDVYQDAVRLNCEHGKWESEWSEGCAFEKAIESGEEEIARIEEETS